MVTAARGKCDTTPSPTLDIAVVGGGKAALCAAIPAARKGARVPIRESAPQPYRGGNARRTRTSAASTRARCRS